MKTTISSRSVRYMYVMFLVALASFAVVESAMGGRAAEGLSTCGTVEQPCALAPLTVAVDVPVAPAHARYAAEGLTECGSEDAPCKLETVQVTAESNGSRLASAQRSLGMTLRVKS